MLHNDLLSKGNLCLSWRVWAHRVPFEATLRQDESVPPEAVSIGVSLDGVMAPMKDGDRQGKREQAQAKGKSPSGAAGYQEVGCGTISY